jgi:hypothetical protein
MKKFIFTLAIRDISGDVYLMTGPKTPKSFSECVKIISLLDDDWNIDIVSISMIEV